jgi:type I restriction enzyme R subunit
VVVDARTDITTKLLSEEGYSVLKVSESEEDAEQTYFQTDFEKKFFSEPTNRVFCETLLKHALRDPISNEIGKTIVFGVSQRHAAKLTQMFNELADRMYPGKYQSNFAVQVTSLIPEAQQFTINFTNNNLLGSANFLDCYKTSKARVCVTVGMMTTGYDCPDILNLGLMRPVFSPTDFIQIKGRGTRKHNFSEQLFDPEIKPLVKAPDKVRYKLFDFFANCEYFEEKFNYDEVLELPRPGSGKTWPPPPPPPPPIGLYVNTGPDVVTDINEKPIGFEGMRIDRMFFEKFEDKVKDDPILKAQVEADRWEQAVERVVAHLFDKPEEYFNLEKLRKAAGVDRRLSVREILQKAFGFIPRFKSKDELLEEAFGQFVLDFKPANAKHIVPMKYFFKAYVTDDRVRQIIEKNLLAELNTNPGFGMADYKAVPAEWRTRIPEYIKDYVPLNQFM